MRTKRDHIVTIDGKDYRMDAKTYQVLMSTVHTKHNLADFLRLGLSTGCIERLRTPARKSA